MTAPDLTVIAAVERERARQQAVSKARMRGRALRFGDIGPVRRRVDLEPMPETAPVQEPSPVVAPEPTRVPERVR